MGVRPRTLKNPLVSIVMTVYNEAHVVAQAIETLLAQSYARIELILVDNGSTDGTSKVLRSYATRKNVRIVSLAKNAGPGGGRNAGAKIAKGEILVFIDADMVFEKNYIDKLIEPIVRGKAIGSFHDTERVRNIKKIWARSFSLNRIEHPRETSAVYRAILREAFESVGGFDTSKGYFDDALPLDLPSVRAHAVCYHNNPETLLEIFHHARWVGRSLLVRDAHAVQRFAPVLALSWLALLAILVLALLDAWQLLLALVLVCAGALTLFLLFKGAVRAVREGYPEFLVTVPIVWLVRLSGYWVGASAALVHGKRAAH